MESKVVTTLNKLRANELFAIAQYMNQHYHLSEMGWHKTAKTMKDFAINEMNHAETLAEMVLYLCGEPVTVATRTVETSHTVDTMFSFDAGIEMQTINNYCIAISEIGNEHPISVNRKIANELKKIVEQEKMHMQEFETIAKKVKETNKDC
jgi:bacterioferritin